MLDNTTYGQLAKLKLYGFSAELQEQEKTGGYKEMSFNDRLSILIQTEFLDKENNRSFVLNNYYTNDFDNYSRGSILYTLQELTQGSHSLRKN